MGALQAARRRQLAAKGRPMVLSRLTPALSVTLQGKDNAFAPDQLQGGVQQGDLQVEILLDELQAASWPDRPRSPDKLTIDGRTYTVRDATLVSEGPTPIGWTLWVRGGG